MRRASIIFRFVGEKKVRRLSTDEAGIFISNEMPTGLARLEVLARGYLPKDLGEVDVNHLMRVILEKDPDVSR